MKKVILMAISVLTMSLFCGCSAYKLNLTASEHDKIAEYAAYALLADVDEYKNKLLTQEEVDRILAEREIESQIKQEMDKLEGQPVTQPQKPTPGVPETTIQRETDSRDDTTGKDKKDELKTLDSILKIENVSIQYSGYEMCSLYPNDPSELVSLKAKDGKQFIALSFVLQNTSNQVAECDIHGRDIVYRLHLSNGDNYKSMLTVMESDFGTWNTPLAPQSMNMAFMLFEVPDTITAQDMADAELSFRENKTTQSVVLK